MSYSEGSDIVLQESPYVFGIDLGTSNSAIAVVMRGQSRVLPVDGEKTCPSVVSFREDSTVLVGKQAKSRTLIDPANTVASIKRQIGTDWRGTFAGQSGKEYTPEDIAAEVLSKLVNAAVEDSTLDGTPRQVVITVPANFTEVQRQATKRAAEMVYLEVLYLLEEPTAAAIAYAVDHDRSQTILVYDLGGGTFDVSILDVETRENGPAEFRIRAKAGVPQLGGDDFDRRIMAIAAQQLTAESGIDIMDLNRDQGVNKKSLREAQQKLKEASERAKIELGEMSITNITAPSILKDGDGHVYDLNVELTREQFEESVRDLLLQSQEAVHTALSAGGLNIDDISRIIMVGASTKMPIVRAMITEMFGREPYSDMDPDTAVARGAAIFGNRLRTASRTDDIVDQPGGLDITPEPIILHDKVSHNLGIEISGGRFSCIIALGTDIPVAPTSAGTDTLPAPAEPLSQSKVFTTQRDNMTEIQINVYQADRDVSYVSDDGCSFIGEFLISGVPAKPRGQEQIEVTFEINQSNLLRVHARSSTSEQAIEVNRS